MDRREMLTTVAAAGAALILPCGPGALNGPTVSSPGWRMFADEQRGGKLAWEPGSSVIQISGRVDAAELAQFIADCGLSKFDEHGVMDCTGLTIRGGRGTCVIFGV